MKTTRRNLSVSSVGVFLCGVIGCTDNAGRDAGTDVQTDTQRQDVASDTGSTQPVTVRFRAMVGNQLFACGQTYNSVGQTQTTWSPIDFRMYVHDLKLVTSTGRVETVQLEQDGTWQHQNVALLDFENRSGRCSPGTAETNTEIKGRIPPGTYTEIRFTLGLPFDLNHLDVATAPSPLNITGMFWSWQSGYKFLKLEGNTTGLNSWVFHLGSTGCVANPMGQVVTPCSAPNRPTIALSNFDTATQVIVADVARLTANSDLNTNTQGTAPGCMSGSMDPECTALFSQLGLSYEGSVVNNPQLFFRVE